MFCRCAETDLYLLRPRLQRRARTVLQLDDELFRLVVDLRLELKTSTSKAERDRIIPLAAPKAYPRSGYYPSAYRITWDEEQREYRIALTQLARR